MIPPLVKTTPLKILTLISLLLFASTPSWGADSSPAQNGAYATPSLAEQGDAGTQFLLGMIEGVAQDYKAVVELYRLAADPKLQHRITVRLGNRWSVAQDNVVSQQDNGVFSKYNSSTCSDAEQGDAEARYKLGLSYLYGKNYEAAVKCFTLAAAQGHTVAQYHLVLMHRNGKGILQGYKEAVK